MFADNVSDPSGWSLGKLNNLREVFGKMKIVSSMSQSMLSEVIFNEYIYSLFILLFISVTAAGESWWMWLLPIKSYLGDGLSFPTRNFGGGDIPDYQGLKCFLMQKAIKLLKNR